MQRIRKSLQKKSSSIPEQAGPHVGNPLHKQQRALRTRHQLIRSARKVFARDGYEHARVEDIATGADKTRGAFYDNFADKEDIFFAIFEEDMQRDQKKIVPMMRSTASPQENLKKLTSYLVELSNDHQRLLLNAEFKLYAIRHPKQRKRLASLLKSIKESCILPEIGGYLTGIAPLSETQRREAMSAVGSIFEGVAVYRVFDPLAFTEEQMHQLLYECFECALRTLNFAPAVL